MDYGPNRLGHWDWESYMWVSSCLERRAVETYVMAAWTGFFKSLILLYWLPPTSSTPDSPCASDPLTPEARAWDSPSPSSWFPS